MSQEFDFKNLQNGSDIRGVASEGIAGQNINLTDCACKSIALGFSQWLCNNKQKSASELSVAIGHDSRISAQLVYNAVASALCSQGIKVYYFALASTPAMFMSCVVDGFNYDGAIMITASHLPFNRNGLKFFTKQGGLDKGDITQILESAQVFSKSANELPSSFVAKNVDFMSVYSNILVEKIRKDVNAKNFDKPLSGLKIIVDAGNGAGGFFVSKVLVPLGANTSGSQFLEPDGTFPNHAPNPEDNAAMASIKKAVLDCDADFGIIFDTDVDRAGAVDRFGNEINTNKLIALLSAIVLQEHPTTTIVTDSITSQGLSEFINERGGIHHRFKRGYKNVINEAKQLNSLGQDCQMAIETSGHGALKENYFLDDGAYLITKILIAIAKISVENEKNQTKVEITDLISTLKEPVERSEFRLNISEKSFIDYGNNILSKLSEYAAQNGWSIVSPNFEGVRINFDQKNGDGWFLLRLSLHDPLMPLNIQSNVSGGVCTIAKKLLVFLNKFEKLDLSSIQNYISNQ